MAGPALPANPRRDPAEHHLCPSREGGLRGPHPRGPRFALVGHRGRHGGVSAGHLQRIEATKDIGHSRLAFLRGAPKREANNSGLLASGGAGRARPSFTSFSPECG